MLSRDPVACRASVSRAYYAVYHEITHQLVEQGQTNFGLFHNGRVRQNPSHERIAGLARNNLRSLNPLQKQELGRLVSRLRNRREEADYRPGMTIDLRTAHEALRDMSAARVILRVV